MIFRFYLRLFFRIVVGYVKLAYYLHYSE